GPPVSPSRAAARPRRAADAQAAGAQTLFVGAVHGGQSWANIAALGLREVLFTVSLVRRPG
ncbi:MAG: hypothetical protein ACI8PZ_003885, partial [Myxococcota bacterium]